MAAAALIAEKARAVVAYAEQFDFVQGELPLSSWKAPAVRHPATRAASHPAGRAGLLARRRRLLATAAPHGSRQPFARRRAARCTRRAAPRRA